MSRLFSSFKSSLRLLLLISVFFVAYAADSEKNALLYEWLKKNPLANTSSYDQNRMNQLAGDAKKTRDRIYGELDEGIRQALEFPKDLDVKTSGDFNKINVDFIYKIY